MKNKINKAFLLLVMIIIGGCETTNLELLENPNSVGPENADTALLLNGAMLNFKDFLEAAQTTPQQIVRMVHMYGPTYDNGITPVSFDTEWSTAYSGVIADTQSIISNGTPLELYEHVGVAKILEAYTIMTLVDFFGDVPYSEAILYTENLNPSLDDDQAVYEAALALLNDALVDFEKISVQSLSSEDDIFYSGSVAKWITLANTLKLRYYNNTRLVNEATSTSEINTLIAANDIILDAANDFEVTYGTSDNDPDTRHYKFVDSYNQSSEYMATYFMNLLAFGKSVSDPRLKYYFYRQTLEYPDPTTTEGLFALPCLAESKPLHYAFNDPFCTIGDGYWGRDHMNNQGGPPDTNLITTWGIYPIGGRYDDGEGEAASVDDGAKGAGILPIWNTAATNFLLAETALELGTTGDAGTYLETAIRASISKVMNFQASAIPTDARVPSTTDVDDYVNEVVANFNAADDTEKLNIIITEAMIASHGNGTEAYNAYRRTGFPDNLQPTITASPGAFARSFPYPSNAANRNQNISVKPNYEVQVFWDTNPAGFIN
jgi:hypothetical protein